MAVVGAPGGGRRGWAAGSAAVIPRLGVTAAVISGLSVTAAVISGLGALAAVISGLGVAAVVISGLGALAAVISGLGVAAVVVNGAGAHRDLDRDALRERRIAHQAGDARHGCDCRHRGGDQQFLHGFFLPWVGLQVVKPEPRLGPPLASRPSTRQAMTSSTPKARAQVGPGSGPLRGRERRRRPQGA